LVNAANPNYSGAITTFRGSQIRILEVSPADVNVTGIFSPGTIVYADATYGVFVLCADFKYLRINIFQLDGTIITGSKLAALGIRPYEQMI
jgi:methionyl-tRNA formyltransferase